MCIIYPSPRSVYTTIGIPDSIITSRSRLPLKTRYKPQPINYHYFKVAQVLQTSKSKIDPVTKKKKIFIGFDVCPYWPGLRVSRHEEFLAQKNNRYCLVFVLSAV